MIQPNGQTVSDVKRNLSANAAKGASKAERKFDSTVSSVRSELDEAGATSPSTLATSVITSALSLLPIKNADEVVEMLETTVKDIRESAITARDSATAFVKKYPVYSLLGAVAIGAGVFMMIRNRSEKS